MPRYAAVDIGSNSVRMEVAEITAPSQFTMLASERDVTRLGEGVFRDGSISGQSLELTCSVLSRMARVMERYDVSGVRAVATSATRDARNQAEFLARASAALGVPVEVISGAEEARLIHLGVHSRWPQPGRQVMIVDIGGGSAEVILGRDGHLVEAFSKPLGAVRLTEMFLTDDPPGDADLRRMDDYIAEKVAPAVRKLARSPIERVIATSATASAVTCAAHRLTRRDRERADRLRVTAAQVRHLFDSLKTKPLSARAKVTGIGPKRAEIIIAGVAVLRKILTEFRRPGFWFCAAGVRDGIIADLFARGVGRELSMLDPDQRHTVELMARRFGVDLRHARVVASLAHSLFSALEGLHGLPRMCGKLLEAAALLMDVGHFVSDSRHHRHSHYLVAHSALPGFTDGERTIIAHLCRYHRKSMPQADHSDFQALPAERQHWIIRLVPLLRIADALDRSRRQPVRSLEARLKPDVVEVKVRVEASAELELWAARQVAALFQEVYGLRLIVGAA